MSQTALFQGQLSLGYQTERTLAFTLVGATYTLMGSLFNEGVVMLYIYSTFDTPVKISLDGTRDWLTMPAGPSAFIFDCKSNMTPLPGGYGVYVKQLTTGPTSGNIYVSVMTVT